MAAADPSSFEEILIESGDGSQSVDLRKGVLYVKYYEDIFSPTVTAKISVINSGPVINGKSLYQGLELKGAERVSLKIKPASDNYLN